MSPFDMGLFINGTLTGAHATRQRHRRQARYIQAAIQQRFNRDNPWTWQLKHVRWFIQRHLEHHAPTTRYQYLLTVRLIVRRLGKERDWHGWLKG